MYNNVFNAPCEEVFCVIYICERCGTPTGDHDMYTQSDVDLVSPHLIHEEDGDYFVEMGHCSRCQRKGW